MLFKKKPTVEQIYIKQFVNYIISLGKNDYDLDEFQWHKNQKLRKKHGFSQENFGKIFNETNINGKTLFELIEFDIIVYNFFRIHSENREDAETAKNKIDGIICRYMLSGDNKYGTKMLDKMTSDYTRIRLGF